MNKNRLIAGLAGTLAFASALANANAPTVVLVTDELPEFHVMQAEKGSEFYVETPQIAYQPVIAGVDPISMAIGGAIGMAAVRHQAAIDAQKRTDERIKPLTENLDEQALQAMLRKSIGQALAGHEMDQTALAYFAEARPDPKLLMRLKAARGAERFVLVGNGSAAREIISMPLTFDPSLRQLRLSLDIELREGKHDRNRRVARRDVTVFTTPVDFAEGEDPLQAWAADDHARLRAVVDSAVAEAFTLALSDRELPRKVARDAAIGTQGELGFKEFQAVLVSHEAGRALLWTRDDTLVSIPADEVLTGEALVAARAAEEVRIAGLDGGNMKDDGVVPVVDAAEAVVDEAELAADEAEPVVDEAE